MFGWPTEPMERSDELARGAECDAIVEAIGEIASLSTSIIEIDSLLLRYIGTMKSSSHHLSFSSLNSNTLLNLEFPLTSWHPSPSPSYAVLATCKFNSINTLSSSCC
jgi:hypothetical protein